VRQKGITHHMKGRNLSGRSLKAAVDHHDGYVSASLQEGAMGLSEVAPGPLQNNMAQAVMAAKVKRYHPAMPTAFGGKDPKLRGELVS
jgi:hypothetical protein